MIGNLDTEEAARLLAACPQAHTLDGLTEDQAEEILTWAEQIRLGNTCLNLALAGKLSINFVDGEPFFSTVENVENA